MRAITLRLCGADDERELRRLAELDSSAPLTGTILAADEGGELRAALALASGLVVADPFCPTTHLVELLQTRAAQIAPEEATTGARLHARLRAARWVRSAALCLRHGTRADGQHTPCRGATQGALDALVDDRFGLLGDKQRPKPSRMASRVDRPVVRQQPR